MPGPGCVCGTCRTCYHRAWRRRNPGKVKAAKDRWGKTRDRAGDPQVARDNSEYNRKNRQRLTEQQRRRRTEDPRKNRANNIVNAAIRSGHLARQPCEKCRSTIRVNAHHEDYDKPMDITWLCPKHHRERHVQLAQGG